MTAGNLSRSDVRQLKQLGDEGVKMDLSIA